MVEGTNTSYRPNCTDKQDHHRFHLCIRLNIGGNTKVNVEGLNFSISILLASAQALDNKLDGLCARINFQRDIRNCNVLCFIKTWLNSGKPDSAIQPGEDFMLLSTDINLPSMVDSVMMQSCFGRSAAATSSSSPSCNSGRPRTLPTCWNSSGTSAA